MCADLVTNIYAWIGKFLYVRRVVLQNACYADRIVTDHITTDDNEQRRDRAAGGLQGDGQAGQEGYTFVRKTQ